MEAVATVHYCLSLTSYYFSAILYHITCIFNHVLVATHQINNQKLRLPQYLSAVPASVEDAFECNPHYHILINQLRISFGVRRTALGCIDSFIRKGTQMVNYNGQASTSSDVECSVPQESVLGPILFLLYMATTLCNNTDFLRTPVLTILSFMHPSKPNHVRIQLSKSLNASNILIGGCRQTV